jgi:hypothetical protein
MPAALAPVLAAIGILATAGAVGAQTSSTLYAIVTSGAGAVVAQLAGNGVSLPAGAVSTTLPGQSVNPTTGATTPLPAGTKVIPLYVVATPAGMSFITITGLKPPPSVKCAAGQLPTLVLPGSGPKSVMAASNWHCKPGGV